MATGLELYANAAYDTAAAVLEEARARLQTLGSPAARWAAFYRAAAEVNRGRYLTADSLLHDALVAATPDEAALVGKTKWALGVNQLRQGNYAAANELYRDAAPHFARAKEPDNQGAVAYLLSEGLSLAGQPFWARDEALRGLRLLAPFRENVFVGNHLTTVAEFARAEGLSHAALCLMSEVLKVAQASGRPQFIARAKRARARDLIAVGRPGAARLELNEASHWADRITVGSGRDRVRADVALAIGQITRATQPKAAYRLLTNVVHTYRRLEENTSLPAALYETALAAQSAGDSADARAFLVQAARELERQQEAFTSVGDRAAFYETVENVFDAIIRTELDRGAPASAFEYLQRGRVAILPTTAGPGAPRDDRGAPTRIDSIGERLPPDMLFIEYAVLNDRLGIWAVSRQGWKYRSVPLSRDSLSALVERFADGIREEADPHGTRARLFDVLIRPATTGAEGITRLAIVPDRELYRLAFSALWDSATHGFLLERYELRTVPSAAYLARATSLPRVARTRAPALVVGNPGTRGALEPLPGATREAASVAGLYRRARLLLATQARRDSVLGLLPSSSVFHFAGHAIFNSEQPELSYLALTPGGTGDPGILHAWEIAGLRLSKMDVVVLSACSTLGPRLSRSGVTAGLAYSFLRAGAPATVSTLWDVDDRATTDLLVDFHQRFAAGSTVSESLRQAQLNALRSSQQGRRSPYAWAAFTYTGP